MGSGGRLGLPWQLTRERDEQREGGPAPNHRHHDRCLSTIFTPLNTVTLSFTPPLFYGLSLSLLKSGLQDFTPAQPLIGSVFPTLNIFC